MLDINNSTVKHKTHAFICILCEFECFENFTGLTLFSSSKRVEKFLAIAKQEINRGFIVSWGSIVINPIATTCEGEYLSKQSEVICALKPPQYSSS